jgi:PHD/YefM family antitoxin component YafN of YafNO toxin-antitoxin module
VSSETLVQEIQYLSDAEGNTVGVLVPIDLWWEIESERETAYLLKSPVMKKRLLEAKKRKGGISLKETRAKLGI